VNQTFNLGAQRYKSTAYQTTILKRILKKTIKKIEKIDFRTEISGVGIPAVVFHSIVPCVAILSSVVHKGEQLKCCIA
jgi:hypothetical protein